MKYNYCPICGEKLPPHHLGKYCKTCSRKVFTKKVIRTAVVTGVVVGAGVGAYFYVKHHKKQTLESAQKLASMALAYEMKKIANNKDALLEVARSAGKALAEKQFS